MKRVRTGFRLILLAGLCLLASAVIAYAVSQSMLVVDSSRSRDLDRLADEGMELVQLTHAVLQYPGPRAIDQWQAQFTDLRALLEAAGKQAAPEDAVLIQRVALRLDVLGALHAKLAQSRDRATVSERSAQISAILSAQLFQEAAQLQSSLKTLRTAAGTYLQAAYEQAGKRQIAMFVVLAFTTTLFGIVVTIAFRRRILEPLSDLERTIVAIGNGQDRRAPILVRDEIGTICAAFNDLLDKQKTAEAKLKASIAELEQAKGEILTLNSELECRVLQRTAQLESANQELEAFAYSVSHDLRAPLRSIDGFAEILEEDYADRLDATGLHHLETVRQSATKMGKLIDDILQFSRMARVEVEPVPIDMGSLAQEVFDEIREDAAPGRHITLKLGPLPPAAGDLSMMRQVFVNLLSNAVKFTAQQPEAVIEVGGVDADGEHRYWVKDNGAGFEMQYVDKLFGAFQRLHNVRDFQGTGVGLAIVKRVIDRHGGRVWAEGKVGEGATFHFTLPRPTSGAL